MTRSRTRALRLSGVLAALVSSLPAAAGDPALLPDVAPGRREAVIELERALLSLPSPVYLRDHHTLVAAAPHVAGTEGDRRVIENLAGAMRAFGLAVEVQEIWLHLPLPIRAEVSIVQPEELVLAVQEPPLAADPDTAHPALTVGWGAYSGSGEATGRVVYANYARDEDFAQLASLGVETAGSIVLARYGKLFRGFKARNAERAGASALLLYLDPADSGWGRGIPYPEGGWANEGSIERGSFATLSYAGDPLTPFVPATREAPRLEPSEVDLPRIPIQPIPWSAAAEVLGRMRGPAVPGGWQGGLPFAYRTEGGDDLVVRVRVEQDTRLRRTANVLGSIRGSEHPEQLVVMGSHHDAWGFGAGDPTAGTIVVLEVARAFGELLRRGFRPRRTVIFAHWGAEEVGIQGSTEWVEAHQDELRSGGVAYLNLDGAAMGLEVEAAASPSLERLIREVMAEVAQPGTQPPASVLEAWMERTAASGWPPFGTLGGGSDHVGFYAHAGVPAASLHGRGAAGTAYHTNYETLRWYRQVVGEGYDSALVLSRLAALLLSRLASSDLLPLDPARWGEHVPVILDSLGARAKELGVAFEDEGLRGSAASFAAEATAVRRTLRERLQSGELSPSAAAAASWEIAQLERLWLHPPGLPQRPWFRHLWAAPDPGNGYGAWVWPEVRLAIEERDPEAVRRGTERIRGVFQRLLTRMRSLIGERRQTEEDAAARR